MIDPNLQADFDRAQRTVDVMTPRPTVRQRLSFVFFAVSVVLFLLSLSSCGVLIGYLAFGR